MLQNALAEGIVAAGGAAVSAGVVPTPAVAFLVQSGYFKAGVVISASHNPAQYNGCLLYTSQGKENHHCTKYLCVARGDFGYGRTA